MTKKDVNTPTMLEPSVAKQAIMDILTNTSLQESLSQKSILRAKQFSWEKCANETVEIYKKN